MKFREHRGSLTDSLETVMDIAPTKEAIAAHARTLLKSFGFIDPEEIDREMVAANINSEFSGYDVRIAWNTYLVTSTYKHMPVIGWHDGPLEDI